MSIASETRLTMWRQSIDEAEPILGDVQPIQLSYGKGALKFLLRVEDFRRLFSGKEVTKETNSHGIFFYCKVGSVIFEANTAHNQDADKCETITLE